MSIRLEDGKIRIVGRCRIEEAETLLALLLEENGRTVDLSAAGPLHAAVVQILLAAKPVVASAPDDPFLCAHVLPLLEAVPVSSSSAYR
jgi:hypothetical protein